MATKIFTKKFNSRIAGLIVFGVILSSLSPIFAKPAQAQWVVWDPGNFAPNTLTAVNTTATVVKDQGLDALAWIIVNLIIERIAASTVNWINSGFHGKPAFVEDPASYFQDLGDKIAGQYIFSNPNLNFLCGPIQAKIRLALTQNYLQDRIWQCTLTDAIGNVEDFMDDFDKGGWDKFFEMTQRQQNNPIGAYLQAENELNLQIATRQGIKQKELDWGNGFLSFEVCGSEGRDTDGTCIGSATIATPGSVIQTQLNKTLGLGSDKLVVADELNEIVSALLNQLVTKVVGGGIRGLKGLSNKDASSGQIFTDQLLNSNSVEGYFCLDQSTNPNAPYYDTDPNTCAHPETADTSAINLPIPSDQPPAGAVPNPVYPTQCSVNPNLPQCQNQNNNNTIDCANNPNAPECAGGGRNQR